MANSEQKTPFALSVSRFAERKVLERIQTIGQSLPASVAALVGSTNTIVTVNFEVQSGFTLPQVTCPVFGPEYIRYPIQVGVKGAVFPVGAYMGGMSGLGGGVADLTQRANLSTLVFFPCGNTNFSATDDPNAVVIYGPDGAILRNTGSTSQLRVQPHLVSATSDTEISLTVGGHSIVINASGVTIDGILWDTHEHTGVQTGSSKTGGPTSP